MIARVSIKYPWRAPLLACLLALALLLPLCPTAARAAPTGWRDTGIMLFNASAHNPEATLCVDPTRPHALVLPEADGTAAYDWSVGPASRRVLTTATLRRCNPSNGWLYGELAGQSMRFSLDAPEPQTGHTLRNSFLVYWEARGGLAQFGYPLSEEFSEVNPLDG